MLPTLEPGELLLVSRRAYQHTEPQRGDIVMARYGADFILKRIVGLPKEEVEVRHGTLYINGVAQQENHGIQEGPLDVSKGKLLDGDYATLGDNRQIPAVLAIHPILSKTDIVGKVILSFRKMF
jgi:signal peptidase I